MATGDSSTTARPRPKIPPAAAIAAIAIVATVLMFQRLGLSDVCGGNEAVEGVFVQQMVEHGQLLFPLENGSVPMYKPPLFHWTAYAIDRVAGINRVTAANLRAPSALYAIAGVLLTMIFAQGLLGLEGALLAGLALVGSYQYVALGRFGRVDMTLCFFETLALFAFVWWLPREAKLSGVRARVRANVGALYLMAMALGLAVLAKGPVGAILPGFSIVVFMVAERRWRQIPAMLDPGALILGGLLASSWYLACYFGGRYGFLDRQLGAENIGRFFGTLGAMKPLYYLKPILLNSAPLSLLVPVAVVAALMTLRRRPASEDRSDAGIALENPARAVSAVRLLAIFYVVTVIFFSLAAYKRRAYLLPLWPASAVMLAWWIRTVVPPAWRRAAARGFAAVCAGLVVFNFVYIPRVEVAACGDDSLRPVAAEIARVVEPSEPLYSYGFKEELAPLLFYLGRNAPALDGRLGDAPPGYIILPMGVWKQHQHEALDWAPVLISKHGAHNIVVLKRGKSYAHSAIRQRYFFRDSSLYLKQSTT